MYADIAETYQRKKTKRGTVEMKTDIILCGVGGQGILSIHERYCKHEFTSE